MSDAQKEKTKSLLKQAGKSLWFGIVFALALFGFVCLCGVVQQMRAPIKPPAELQRLKEKYPPPQLHQPQQQKK